MDQKIVNRNEIKVVAIGASIGGTEALVTVLSPLPEDFPCVIVTQHMYPGFIEAYTERVDSKSKMKAVVAEDSAPIQNGIIYFADNRGQMRVVKKDRSYILRYGGEEKVSGHCPSVDVLFSSIAEAGLSPESIGVILTGMGHDGSDGILAMRKAGAYTIGQDEQTCVVYGMPKAAYQKGAIVRQLSLDKISSELIAYVMLRNGVKPHE